MEAMRQELQIFLRFPKQPIAMLVGHQDDLTAGMASALFRAEEQVDLAASRNKLQISDRRGTLE
jgi:hypothetical protein